MNRSYSKIRSIQESNRLLEERMLNEKKILTEQVANDGWLTYPNDKNYQYKNQNGKWIAKIIKTGKVIDLSKYPTTIKKLDAQFPNAKSEPINTLPQKPLQTLDGKTVATQPVQYKNEKLPDAPVYYPWIQDGKLNTEKLKQSIEDNSINKWLDELKKLTPEQLTKVRQDLKSSGIPTNLTTTKGTGLYYNLIELLKIAEKSIQTNNNNDISGSSNPQQNLT